MIEGVIIKNSLIAFMRRHRHATTKTIEYVQQSTRQKI